MSGAEHHVVGGAGAASLRRDPPGAAANRYDLIVVGGGVYGAALALEAARRGLRPLLLERDDFGGATSWNSHRIVHGGLRYLQRLDLERFRVSVRERRWFLLHFPDLVKPLPCLMPLYGRGARRPSIMRAALLANHLLSLRRNDGLRSDRRLESGGVMTVPETVSLFPGVDREGLRGGALWYDAVMTDSQRLLIEMLRWAADCGAVCLNYVEVTGLRTEAGTLRGVEATDRHGGGNLGFAADRVINCAGPWSRDVAVRLDRDVPELFTPSLAFNLLFDREPPSEVALALSAPRAGAHTWFLCPRGKRLYAGTAHFSCPAGTREASPSRQQIDEVIDEINAAAPGLELRRHQVLRVHSGLLPAAASGDTELTARPIIHDHGAAGGPTGLVSVSGIKYTTARDVAERALGVAFGGDLAAPREGAERPAAATWPDLTGLDKPAAALRAGGEPRAGGFGARSGAGGGAPGGAGIGARTDVDAGVDGSLAERLRQLAANEAALHLDDLLLRRGAWGDDPERARRLGGPVAAAMEWDEKRTAAELSLLDRACRRAIGEG
jgi:glycerol-3-phosphate dehydrogenase